MSSKPCLITGVHVFRYLVLPDFLLQGSWKFPEARRWFSTLRVTLWAPAPPVPPSARRLFSSCSPSAAVVDLATPHEPKQNRAKPGETKCWFSATMWIIHVNYEHLISGQWGKNSRGRTWIWQKPQLINKHTICKMEKHLNTGWCFEPLWKIRKSVGMMKFPIYGKS